MEKVQNVPGVRRIVLEIVLGVLAAAPVGMWLYVMSVVVWAEAIPFLAIPGALVPYVGSQIMVWLDFSSSVTLLLGASAVVTEVWFCRMLVRRHYPVFAYTQAILGLAVSAPLFYWTMVHQKPLLPFWGQ